MGPSLASYYGAVEFYYDALRRIVEDHAVNIDIRARMVEHLVATLAAQQPPALAADIHRQVVRAGEDAVLALRAALGGDIPGTQADVAESSRIAAVALARLLDRLRDDTGEV